MRTLKLGLSQAIAAIAITASMGLHSGCGNAEADKQKPGGQADKTAPASVPAPAPNATDPRWVVQADPKAKRAIVFVHGLFGDTMGTWTNANGTRFFDHVEKSRIGKQFDVFAFGYTSKMLGAGSLNIVEATGKLDQYLRFHGVLDYPSVTFVGHSMGGLVILRHLISDSELRRKVSLVALYATPQEGAQIAAIGDRVAKNPALAQMFPANGNAYLQQLDADWKRLQDRPHVACGYEKRPTAGVMIVPFESATRFCSGQAVAIEDEDHLSLVKPDRPEHPSVVLLVTALEQHVLKPPPPGQRRLDMKVSFKPFQGIGKVIVPPALELTLEEPVVQGPYGFRASGKPGAIEYLHQKFLLSVPGERMSGYMNRALYTAYVVDSKKAARPLETRVCFKVTNVASPPDALASLDCEEGHKCIPSDTNGALVGCGGNASLIPTSWWDWLPLPTAVAATDPKPKGDVPQDGDWIIPRIESLRAARPTPEAQAFSEVSLAIADLAPQGGADAITFEARINGRRLWVQGLPPDLHATPLVKGEPAAFSFGLENLNSAGKDRGRERLEVRIVLLKDRRPVADDTVVLDFIALRDLKPSDAKSAGGRSVRWSATYYPTPTDQYQIIAYGGLENDTLAAKGKFDAAKLRSLDSDALPLVGVVRPPNRNNNSWGISVGQVRPTGQVRFSFSKMDAVAACKAMIAEGARGRLRRQGFSDPGGFGVREIADPLNDERRTPQIPCGTFSAT